MEIENIIKQNEKNTFVSGLYHVFNDLTKDGFVSALDVGCGKGLWSYLGAKKNNFENISACDIFDDFQNDEISKVANKVEYRKIENNLLPFSDNSFDLVFSMDVIEHVENDVLFLQEKIRVTRHGGKIIIGTPNYFRIGNLALAMVGKLKYPRLLGHMNWGDCIHLREYRKSDLLNLLNLFKNDINQESIMIVPYYFGVQAFKIGVKRMPRYIEKFCHYWFIKFSKK